MLIGQQIGPFLIEKEIGYGAMGVVYKAQYSKEGKTVPVAMKMISLGLLGNDAAMARFEREAAILKQLKHPHIVRLFATGKVRQTPFIAMEFIDGETLDRILIRRGKLDWQDVITYGKQLCDALQHAHDKGIIHRDLKPSNLMITRDGTIKLTDFGIAKDTDVTALTGANSTIGTAAYMSPEQCKGDRNLTPKSDLYSLGVVFYELITGKKPFVADTPVDMFLKHVKETPVRPRKLVHDIPVWLDNLIMFLLEKDKEHRPIDAGTVTRLLGEIEEKVTTHQSVGAEVANSRRIDRPVTENPLDEADKNAARSLKFPGKKRKKKSSNRRRIWLQAVPLALGLLLVLGFAGYLLKDQFRSESLDEALVRVEQAETDAARVASATAILRAFPESTDPRLENVREIYKQSKAREVEEILTRRLAKGLKGTADRFPEEAFKTAMQAVEEEQAGRLKSALAHWTLLAAAEPAIDPAQMTRDEVADKAVLNWLARSRVELVTKEVPSVRDKARKRIDDLRTFDQDFTLSATDPFELVVKAFLYQDYNDPPKTQQTWSAVKSLSESDHAHKAIFLFAAEQIAKLDAEKTPEDHASARATRLTETLEKHDLLWQQVQNNPDDRVSRRTIRVGCREIICLYEDERDEAIKAIVARARKLLETVK